jgi:hypothetical protein
MQKMKLEIESLVVDSFAADDRSTGVRGTVRGNGVLDVVTVRLTCYTGCGGSTCEATGSPCVAC